MFPDTILYGGEGATIETFTETERAGWFGKHDLQKMHPPVWEADGEWWRTTNIRAANAIQRNRQSERDLVLITGGVCQQAIRDMLTDMIVCEPFVGYEGTCTDKRAFESESWRHHIYGLDQNRYPGFWDTVIPNYFDPDEFPTVREKAGSGDYLLFLGRVTQKKGPHVAAEIAEKAGLPLIIAGPGVTKYRKRSGKITGEGAEFRGKYVGAVGIQERAELLAGARALICPTLYVEPFGGVAVEAMLAGVPVLATDFGAFTETVTPAVGRRFSTMREAIQGLAELDALDPAAIRREALGRYSLDAVAPRFTAWLERLQTLWGDGWYEGV